MVICRGKGCSAEVTKQGHFLCYSCWKKENNSQSTTKPANENQGELLTATKIGEHFSISGQKANLLLSELGWMYKPRHGKGWKASKQGKKQGAVVREVQQSGAPYVMWPSKILRSKALRRAVAEFKGEELHLESGVQSQPEPEIEDFRQKFPATYRCMDGHYVRSRAEAMIDNWLYTNGIAHAYEKKLPIESDVYSDFYIKAGKSVYIEFWGMESDQKYARRKAIKQKAYQDNDFNLIELNDSDLNNLDDVLPRKLLQFDIRVN